MAKRHRNNQPFVTAMLLVGAAAGWASGSFMVGVLAFFAVGGLFLAAGNIRL